MVKEKLHEARQMIDVELTKDKLQDLPVDSGHVLINDEIRAKLPALYSQKESLEAVAPVKYFLPDSFWTWYVSEFDGEDTCYGLIVGYQVELSYFSLRELQELRDPFGVHQVEHDPNYEPKTLRQLMRWHRNQHSD